MDLQKNSKHNVLTEGSSTPKDELKGALTREGEKEDKDSGNHGSHGHWYPTTCLADKVASKKGTRNGNGTDDGIVAVRIGAIVRFVTVW